MNRESIPQLVASPSGWPTLITEWSKGKLEVEVCEDEDFGDQAVIIVRTKPSMPTPFVEVMVEPE